VLHARGEKVRILDILDVPDLPAGIDFIRADILDPAGVALAMQGVDVVHHNAALVPLTKAGSGFWRVNVEGTETALNAAKKAGVKFFIHVSSSAVFGVPASLPITADTPLRPIERYGLSKMEAERRVGRAVESGLPCAIVRPRTIVGPGRLGIFKILYDWIYEGRRIYVIGNGNHLFQFVHSQDLIEFMVLLAQQRKPGKYNIGAERFGTLRQDLTALIRHAKTPARIVGTPAWLVIFLLEILDLMRMSPLAPWHYKSYHKPFYFDLSQPMKELGWKPRFSNEETFCQSYDWFVAHRNQGGEEDQRSTHRKSVKQGILWVLRKIS
jgi:nucleoside-diphosphate-sugar epimerase